MEIEITITKKDFVNFHRYFYLKKRRKTMLILILAISLIMPFTLGLKSGFFNFWGYLFIAILANIILSSLYFATTYILLTFVGFLPSKNGSILGIKKFTIETDGLIEETQQNRNLYKWSGIKSLEENKNYLYIFTDNISAYIFPKRYFNNKGHFDSFVNEVKSKIELSKLNN